MECNSATLSRTPKENDKPNEVMLCISKRMNYSFGGDFEMNGIIRSKFYVLSKVEDQQTIVDLRHEMIGD